MKNYSPKAEATFFIGKKASAMRELFGKKGRGGEKGAEVDAGAP
ncbi:hypothetical protein [uncultured Mailhella sp.]